MTKLTTIDEYIKVQTPETAKRLEAIRQLFHQIIPDTQESIRYDMPAFSVGGYHLYVGAYKNHIGMYPMYGIPELEDELLRYRGKRTEDALHFKHSEPLPLELIEKIIRLKNKKKD